MLRKNYKKLIRILKIAFSKNNSGAKTISKLVENSNELKNYRKLKRILNAISWNRQRDYFFGFLKR